MGSLQIEQGKSDFLVSNSISQGSGAPKKKKYRDRQLRLEALVAPHAQRGTLSYLRAVAHDIMFRIWPDFHSDFCSLFLQYHTLNIHHLQYLRNQYTASSFSVAETAL